MRVQPVFARPMVQALCVMLLAGSVSTGFAQYTPPYDPGATTDPFAVTPGYAGMPADSSTPGGVSPFMNNNGAGDASFGATPGYVGPTSDPFATPQPNAGYAPGVAGNAMTAWSSATNVAGLKYSYNSQFGDYYSLQNKNTGKWEQFPLTVYMTMPEEMSDEDKAAVKAALSAWQKTVDITLVDQPDQAKIEIAWVSELSDDVDLGETDFSATHIDSFGRTIYDKAIIRMLDPAEYASVYPDVLQPALMHQLGHALGINTHSDNYRDLMAEPSYKKQKNPILKKTLRAFATKTLGQFIDLPSTGSNTTRKKANYPLVDKITKRDMNTLYRLYNGS